jgi:hypothetical protein
LVALMQPSPVRDGPPAYSLPSAVKCYHCEGAGHYARECTSSAKCYICGAPHNKLMCPWYQTRATIWCSYCRRKGHVDMGCSRKARGLEPVPHAGPGQDRQVQAVERTLAQNLGRATKPYPTSVPRVPALDDIRRMVTSAAGQLGPRQRRALFGSLAAMLEQDALQPAADFRPREGATPLLLPMEQAQPTPTLGTSSYSSGAWGYVARWRCWGHLRGGTRGRWCHPLRQMEGHAGCPGDYHGPGLPGCGYAAPPSDWWASRPRYTWSFTSGFTTPVPGPGAAAHAAARP